jgi:mutator protein MutT
MSRQYPSQPIVGVGAVILHQGRVLLARRGNPPLAGEWSIPGGKLELGEKLREGLEREVREETGLKVEAAELLDVFDSIFTDAEGRTEYHYVLVDFLCHLRAGVAAAASDAIQLAWATPDELDSYGLRPATSGVIRKAFALLAR